MNNVSSSTTSVKQIFHRRAQLISTGRDKYIPTDRAKVYDNDSLYTDLSDLVNPQFKPWYCKRFYALGVDRVLTLAAQARADGRDPRRLFSKLVKNG